LTITPKSLPAPQNRACLAEFEPKVESHLNWCSGKSLTGVPEQNSFGLKNLTQTQFVPEKWERFEQSVKVFWNSNLNQKNESK
jgi:hypothetical protein